MKTFDELISVVARQAMHEDHRIKGLISRIVPSETVAHIQFCRLEGRVLRITVDNSAWLSRLRFNERQIIDELRRENLLADKVSWHVTPEKPIKITRTTERKAMTGGTPRSAAIVQSTADAMEDDELKDALLKIAAKLEKR